MPRAPAVREPEPVPVESTGEAPRTRAAGYVGLPLLVRPLPLASEPVPIEDGYQDELDSTSVYINDSGRYLLTAQGVLDVERDALHVATTDEARLQALFTGPYGWVEVERMEWDPESEPELDGYDGGRAYRSDSIKLSFQSPQLVIADAKHETILVAKRPTWWFPPDPPPPAGYFALPEDARFRCPPLVHAIRGAWLSRKHRMAVVLIDSYQPSCVCGDQSVSRYHAIKLPSAAPL